eukprot:CCRYP_008492-RA/>CCRYP_008492-RA protein AED:0.38 eAED:0.38 QI:0/0/0/1/0/0/2/0/121
MNKARGTEMAGFITDPTHIRAALLVLLQHSLIAASGVNQKIRLGAMRQPLRARQAVDENGAMIVETLLIHGRMRAEDVLACVWDVMKRRLDVEEEDAVSNSGNTDDAAKDWDEDEPSMEEI